MMGGLCAALFVMGGLCAALFVMGGLCAALFVMGGLCAALFVTLFLIQLVMLGAQLTRKCGFTKMVGLGGEVETGADTTGQFSSRE